MLILNYKMFALKTGTLAKLLELLHMNKLMDAHACVHVCMWHVCDACVCVFPQAQSTVFNC